RAVGRGRHARGTVRGLAAPLTSALGERRHQTTELPRIDGPQQVLLEAGLQQSLVFVATTASAYRDGRDLGTPRRRPHALDQGGGALSVGVEVDEEDVGPDGLERRDGTARGRGGADEGACVLYDGPHQLARRGIVDVEEDVDVSQK